MKIVDGKAISEQILTSIAQRISKLKTKTTLAVILVGSDPASELYVRIKERTCQKVGIIFKKYEFANDYDENKIVKLIKKLNLDQKISGIIVQLPLPKKLNTNLIINTISPNKDVDGLNATNLGKLLIGAPTIIPPTPAAILEILKFYKINLTGKHLVLVGYGKLVGKPLAAMLATTQRDATVTICNKDTKNLSHYTKQADILITAIGVPNLITKNMVKNGVVVIDAGTTIIRVENREKRAEKKNYLQLSTLNSQLSKVVGDVDFEGVKKTASLITAPTGGVGPLTVAKLLENVVNIR